MESVSLKGEKREPAGRRAAGRLRKKGLLPAIIYGHGEPPVAVTLDRETLTHQLRRGAQLVDLEMDGQVSKLLVKAVQYDYLGTTVTHVDLARVSLDERVEVAVPLRFRGEPVGVRVDGGQLLTPLTEIDIECLVVAIPDEIRVNVGELKIGEQITIADVELPEGIRALGNPEQVVALVSEPLVEAAAGEPAETGAAEPEIIGRKAEEEPAEGEKPAARTRGEKKSE